MQNPTTVLSMRRAVRSLMFAVVMVLNATISFGQEQTEDEQAKAARVDDILVALGAQDGRHVADLGSGNGFYTLRIARAVAPTGRAYAIDIEQKALDQVRERAANDGVSNIDLILGDTADPKLPAGQLDGVLIRNAYHEMTEHRSVLASVAKGLKAGGILVVSEVLHDNNRGLTRDEQVKKHEIAPEIVEQELRDAGFEIIDRQEQFTRSTRSPGGFWLIRARRP
jgi:ubiquinone/menaquinone biosynthesis C-methylase UbiE